MRTIVLPLAAILMSACTPKPSTAAVCKHLADAGVAANCRPGQGRALSALASDYTEFDLPSVPGKGGAVMGFKDARDYGDTVERFRAAAVLAGPHRYGSEKALIFVQMNDKAPPSVGQKVKQIIETL